MSPSSLKESLDILATYRQLLTAEQIKVIENVIRTQAIEGHFCDQDDIDRCVRAQKGEISHEEAMQEIMKAIQTLENE